MLGCAKKYCFKEGVSWKGFSGKGRGKTSESMGKEERGVRIGQELCFLRRHLIGKVLVARKRGRVS